MDLKKIKRRLYKRKPHFEERLEEVAASRLEKQEKAASGEWAPVKKKKRFRLTARHKKFIRSIVIVVVSLFLLVSLIVIWRGLTSFNQDKIKFVIQGPERMASGEETVYRVVYENKTRTALQDVKLIFRYPPGSLPSTLESIDLADLPGKESNTVALPVKLFGAEGETKKATAELSYRPSNLSSRFSHQAEFVTEIISVPVSLSLSIPDMLAHGQSFDISMRVINETTALINDIHLELNYPAGFVMQSADPEPERGDNVWTIESLTAYEEKEIKLQGVIQGSEGEVKTFRAELGIVEEGEVVPYLERTESTRLSLSPLLVSQTINGETEYVAQAGETLTYKITFKNTTNAGIRDAVLTSQLTGAVLDWTTLKTDDGSFSGQDNTITWKAGNLSALGYLDPYEEGTVSFDIELKGDLPVYQYSDKNFTIRNVVVIDALEVPPGLEHIDIRGEDESITKVASQLTLQAQGYYYDNTIPNSGPIPPRVNQTTTYTIKWRLVNYANDLENVEVECYLPPQVEWLNNFRPSDEDLQYYPQTGRLAWRIDRLPAATGVLLPVKEVSFQVGLVPNITQVGDVVQLMGQSMVDAYDTFTQTSLTAVDDIVDTASDPALDWKGGQVVE